MGISQVVRLKDVVHKMVHLHIRFYFIRELHTISDVEKLWLFVAKLSLYIYIYIYIFVGRCCKNTNKGERIFIFLCGNKMTTCNRGFYCRPYCSLNMFRAPLCPSSGAQEYYTVVVACGISCCGFQVVGLVWS